jgi:hypothetical protein
MHTYPKRPRDIVTPLLMVLALSGFSAGITMAQISAPTEEELDAVPNGHKDIARNLGPVGGNITGKNANDPGRRGGGGPNGPPGAPGFGGGPPGANGVPGNRGSGPAMASNADPRDLRGYWSGRGAQTRSYTGDRPGPIVKSKYELALLCLVSPGVNPTGGEIFQSADMITWLTGSDLRARRIYLNAEHPKNLRPTYSGHSVAKWEGDTLVVDTIGVQGVFGYTADGFHRAGTDVYDQPTKYLGQKLPGPSKFFKNTVIMATPTLHVVERIKKVNNNTQLQNDLSFEDPATGMKPYTMLATYNFSKQGAYTEQLCEDGNDKFGPAYAQEQDRIGK